jgi:Ca-activated chloride channel family protein
LILFIAFYLYNTILTNCQQLPEIPKPKPPLSRILFIFDASGSMNGYWEKELKINVARNILIEMVDSLEKIDNIEMALRVFGHQKPVPPQDCSDSKLEVPFSKDNASKIRQKLRYISAMGTTPLAASLAMAIDDFGNLTDTRNIIILITDGIEECNGDPCAVSRDLQVKGIALKPFIIGIGIDEGFKKSFDCIGTYFDAKKEEQFKDALKIVINQALNATTAQVNLLDINGQPTETNVNMSFYDYYSGKLKQSYIHTMNHRGNPDTLILDPLETYRLVVNTIPQVEVDSFKLTAGKHNIVATDAPQGYLVFKGEGPPSRYINVIIRKAGDMNSLNYQGMNKSEKYLVGKYDIEIPVLPKILLYNVDIKQSSTTTVEIPQAGIVTFLMNAPGYGSIYLRENGKDMKWIYNLDPELRNESVYLQPGSYTVVYRAMNAKQVVYTVTRSFDINGGGSKVVELY